MWIATFAAGCVWLSDLLSTEENERKVRVWEMQDHEGSALAARDAIVARDLEGARAAGVELAREDPVPGIPDSLMPALHQVRAAGRELSTAPDLASASERLVTVTTSCASCHLSIGIQEIRPLEPTPRDMLWTAMIFESEARWQSAVQALGENEPALALARDWKSRRETVARLLAEGRP